MEGKLCNYIIFVLIYLGSKHIYFILRFTKKGQLAKEAYVEPQLVQIATKEKTKINYWMRSCEIELNIMTTTTHFNLFPLGVHNMLLGMDWMYAHKTKVYFFEKEIECMDKHG